MPKKTMKIGTHDIDMDHAVETSEDHQVHIRCTFACGDKSIKHVMTVGAADEPLPEAYDQAAMQKDIDDFKLRMATLFESKLRAAELAANLT
jgi:hypothetical protein